MEENAAAYVRLIKEVRPEGPYHLLGWSFGGLLAYEMAVRLRAAGDEVGVLTVLDSFPAPTRPTSGTNRSGWAGCWRASATTPTSSAGAGSSRTTSTRHCAGTAARWPGWAASGSPGWWT